MENKSKGSPFISNTEDITEWYVLFSGEYIIYKSERTYEDTKDKAMLKSKESGQVFEIYCYEEIKDMFDIMKVVSI